MNLHADRWVVGEDYFEAPTCATCHMTANPSAPSTYDVGLRLSWTLRPPVSERKPDWAAKRDRMKQVCQPCHGAAFVDGHYRQFDGVVRLFDRKFAKPAADILALLRKKGVLERSAAFANSIEWAYWELWHHEGRRARHGAAMMGPDFTFWHGLYDVAKHFYFDFLPKARQYADPDVNQQIDRLLADDPLHQWLSRSTDEIKADIRSGKMQQLYRDFYEPGAEP